MKPWNIAVLLTVTLVLVSGCVRTEEFNQRIAEDLPQEVQEVQNAVDMYRKEHNNVLPLKPPQGDTLYQKYILDLAKLEPYLSGAPSNSFQKGGNFVFVAVDPGDKPKVKVMDLRVTETLRKLQTRVQGYRDDHGTWPAGEKVGEGIYRLDFKKLDAEPVTIPSPYHSELSLPLLIDSDGTLHVDYRMDVVQILETLEKKPDSKADLRKVLYADSLFVPAYSPPMHLEDGDPVLSKE